MSEKSFKEQRDDNTLSILENKRERKKLFNKEDTKNFLFSAAAFGYLFIHSLTL